MPQIQYQLDEYVAKAVAVGVRRHGMHVVTAEGIGLLGRPEPEVLTVALLASRVIVTNDADYLALDGSRAALGVGVADEEAGEVVLGEGGEGAAGAEFGRAVAFERATAGSVED